MKHKIRLNGRLMLDKQSAMTHLSNRFGLRRVVTNLDALWDELSGLNRIEKITLIHSEELIAYEYGQKILKLLIDFTHLKTLTFNVK